MKDLRTYILEATNASDESEPEVPASIKVTFDFKDLEDGKETKESLLKMIDDVEHSENDEKVTLTIKKEDADKASGAVEMLTQFSDKIGSSPKRTNDEQYAQLCKKFAKAVNQAAEFISLASVN